MRIELLHPDLFGAPSTSYEYLYRLQRASGVLQLSSAVIEVKDNVWVAGGKVVGVYHDNLSTACGRGLSGKRRGSRVFGKV